MLRQTVVFALALAAVSARSESQTKVERGQRLNPDGAIRISNLVGSVRVTAWDRDSVALHGVLPKGDKLFMGGSLNGMKLFIEPMNDRNPQPSRLEVMVPARAKVWVKTATADIDISGLTGELDLYVVSGTIRVAGNPAELNAEAIDGDIRVTGSPGWLRAKSASGDVSLKGTSRDVTMSTVSGAIAVNGGKFERAKFESVTGAITFNADIERAGALDFDTHSGAVDITIPRNSGADFEIASIAGTISNELNFGRPVAGRYGRGSDLAMTNGHGGAHVVIRSFKGPVTLHSAK